MKIVMALIENDRLKQPARQPIGSFCEILCDGAFDQRIERTQVNSREGPVAGGIGGHVLQHTADRLGRVAALMENLETVSLMRFAAGTTWSNGIESFLEGLIHLGPFSFGFLDGSQERPLFYGIFQDRIETRVRLSSAIRGLTLPGGPPSAIQQTEGHKKNQ